MKKLLSTLLTVSLLTSGAPAFAAAPSDPSFGTPKAPAKGAPEAGEAAVPYETAAEEPAASETAENTGSPSALSERLRTVMLAVKDKLGIGDEYEEFTGEPDENTISPRWDLTWSSEGQRLNVTAGEDGKIYSYRLTFSDDDSSRFWGLDAAFPKVDKAAALAAAQRFADSLMGSGESVKLKTSPNSTDGLYFTGTLLMNGLPSPVEVSLNLRAEDLAPSYFRRSDSYTSTYPEVPSPKSATTAAKAGELLRPTLKLVPRYVRSNDDDKAASLRYVRITDGEYIVTASDGKLVNLNKVYSDLARSSTTTNAKFEAAADAGAPEGMGGSAASAPSAAELKSIESMKDVHTKEALDTAARAIPALGLGSEWTLERASYSMDQESGDVSAALRYTRPMNAGERKKAIEELGEIDDYFQTVRKNITLDARTDELQSVYTSNYYWMDEQDSKQTAAQRAAAEAFLSEQFPGKWAEVKLDEDSDGSTLRYVRQVNGYPFQENGLSISMGTDNTVSQLDVSWDDDVKFAPADDILTPEEAVAACVKAFEMPLSYIEYPQMKGNVLSYHYVLAYAFRSSRDEYFGGIDAKTGEPIWTSYRSQSQFEYDDLAGAFGRTQIEALAAYGIGLPGGSFRPKDTLDQKTMLILLLSACGNRVEPRDESGLDELYSMAYNENLLKAADRNPDAAVTRLSFLKTLLGASAYGEAAKVQGIYTCPFTDRAQIAQADLGYAALAYGLGVARGDDKGRLNPGSTMTRQEAAVMLYNFMMR